MSSRLPRTTLRYTYGILAVAIALGAALALQSFDLEGFLFVIAVAVSVWFGGRGPGLVAVVLSVLVLDYFFLPHGESWRILPSHIAYFLIFSALTVLLTVLSETRHQAERSLVQDREQLEARVEERTAEIRKQAALLGLAHDAIIVRDLYSRITFWNRGAEETYGWSAAEAIGRVTHDLLQTVFPAPLDAIQSIVQERGNWEGELRHVTRVTTLGEVTASFAHEVNQPLAAIANNANACLGLLPSGRDDLDEVRDALGDIVRDAERASAIIERVRALARRSAAEKVPLQLEQVVEDVIALAASDSATRRVIIRTDVAAHLPAVSGDRVQLQQVLLNLVVNGMDAMSTIEERGRLLVIRGRQETRDGTVAATISVHDRGVGLGVRSSGAPSTRSHHQAARHGHGPRHQPPDHRGPRRPIVGGAERGAGGDVRVQPASGSRRGSIVTEAEPTVFVVDDDPSLRTSTERLLRSVGFRVQTFGSAQDFLARARPEGPACLLLDVRLPGLSGLDLQRELARSGVQIPTAHHGARGHPHDGPGDEGGGGRVPDQASSGSRRCSTSFARRSNATGRHARNGSRPGRCASATSSSRRASARSWRSSSQACSTSRSPASWRRPRERSSFIARTSCRRWRPTRWPRWSGWLRSSGSRARGPRTVPRDS